MSALQIPNPELLRKLARGPHALAQLGGDKSNTRRALLAHKAAGRVACDEAKLWSLTDQGRQVLAGLDVAEGKAAPAGGQQALPADRFYPDPLQPRREFDAEKLQALSVSIAENGMLLPVLVRPANPDGRHMIIDGERRWRAAAAAGVPVPFVVRERQSPGAGETLDMQLAANAQRADLNPIEEAQAFRRRLDDGGSTLAIARTVGKTQRYVQERLQLLQADPSTQAAVAAGELGVEAALDRVRQAKAEAVKDAPLTPKLLLCFAEIALAAHPHGGTAAPILHQPAQGAGPELERRELIDLTYLHGGPHVRITKDGWERLTALLPGGRSIVTRQALESLVADARAQVLTAKAIADLGDRYATDWLNLPPPAAAPAQSDPPPQTAHRAAAGGGEPSPAEAMVEGAAPASPQQPPAPPRDLSRIKLLPHEATALAELAHKALTDEAPPLPGFTAILDDGRPRTDLMKLEHEGLARVVDAEAGLLAQATQDGCRWLLEHYRKPYDQARARTGRYATPWLNPPPASPPHSIGGAGDLGQEHQAEEEPEAAASPTVGPASGSTSQPDEPLPHDPRGWARRLIDKARVGDAQGVYQAVTTLMRISGTPEVSGDALRRAWVVADIVDGQPEDPLWRAAGKVRDWMAWRYAAIRDAGLLGEAEPLYGDLTQALDAAKRAARAAAEASAARQPQPAPQQEEA